VWETVSMDVDVFGKTTSMSQQIFLLIAPVEEFFDAMTDEQSIVSEEGNTVFHVWKISTPSTKIEAT